MTDYNPPTDGEIATGSAIKGSTATKLRDNPIAIAEGAAGAPRIHTAALYAPASGTTIIARDLDNTGIGHDSGSRSRLFPVLVAGTVTMSIRITDSGSPVPVTEFFINETSLGTETGTGTHTVDVDVSVGDILYMVSTGTGPGGDFNMLDICIKSSTGNMAIA